MTIPRTIVTGAVLMLFSFAGFSCARYETNPAEVPDPATDEVLVEQASDETAPTVANAEANEVVTREVVLAGGCFWCTEAVYEQLDGVLDVESGYSGGAADTANYDAVTSGTTGHAEAIRITYDASKITLGQILKVFFTTAHDPTQLNRQGNDRGTQYRSAFFYADDEQKKIAEDYIKQLDAAGVYSRPIVTTLEPLSVFYPAEAFHQDFARQNPNQGYIRAVSTPKVEKTREAFPELLSEDE